MSHQKEKLHPRNPKPYLPLLVPWPPTPKDFQELLALINKEERGSGKARGSDY